jgi:asparagine synthetase B (glutamine-hydrolysing)
MGHTGPNRTIYRAVVKLLPGRLYRWRHDAAAPWRTSIQQPPARRESTVDLADALENAVAASMSDGEIGCFLSGGPASTLLAALAVRTVPDLQTFHVRVPSSPADDESAAVEHNALLLGAKHTTVPASIADLGECAWTAVRGDGEPSGDAEVLPRTLLARHATSYVEVALAGDGAGEVCGAAVRTPSGGRRFEPVRTAVGFGRARALRWARGRRRRTWQSRVVDAGLRNGGSRAPAALLDGDTALLAEVRPAACADLLARSIVDRNEPPRSGEDRPGLPFYLRTRWLPEIFLDTTQRAAAPTGLDVRLPYLGAGVETARAVARRGGRESGSPLRDLLAELAPDVRATTGRKGNLSYRDAILEGPLRSAYRYELSSARSVLGRWLGTEGQQTVAARAARSAPLRYRLAVLGVWDQEFDGERFACPG